MGSTDGSGGSNAAIVFDRVSKVYPGGVVGVSELDLAIGKGEFLCLLGPSGCGKSSSLRMLAGLETVSAGTIRVGGRPLNDVPPQRRNAAMVFENYALYPHLSAFDNIAMPLVAQRRLDRETIQRRVLEVAELLRIGGLLDKRPRQLSGGERQRVGIGRAIARRPAMFLMDEPLGHLEAYLRVDLRGEIRRLHERLGTTTVYVTHDQNEAAAVGDRIAVMHAGRLQQVGTLLDLLDRPINRTVAEFIGELPINLLEVRIAPGPRLVAGPVQLGLTPEQAISLATLTGEDARLTFGIRPEDVTLVDPALLGALPGTVTVIEPQGETSVVIADTELGRVSCVVESGAAPREGAPIGLRLDPARGHLFSADGRNLVVAAAAGGRT